MPNKFDKLAEEAKAITDAEFSQRFATLTKLNETDVNKIIKSTGISREQLADLLTTIKAATDYNNKTAQSIVNIQNGVNTLVAMAKKLLF